MELATDRPNAIALTETWTTETKPLPSLPRYGRVFEAPRPGGGGRGGVSLSLADSWGVAAKEWAGRSRPADGVLWVRIDGALPEAQVLFVAVCYLPPVGSGGCPQEREEWWQKLRQDWAEAEGLGLPLWCGDTNAHTGCKPDWPEDEEGWQPRSSRDMQKPSSSCHGREQLDFCCSSTARICNGRVPGNSGAMATSFGVRGTAQSVVDYFVVAARLLPLVLRLVVLPDHPAAELSDHAVLQLTVSSPGPAQPAQPQPPQPAPSWPSSAAQQSAAAQRQFRLDPERLVDAVEALDGLWQQLTALADAAEVARDLADLEGVAAWFSEVVCNALEQAHMREMVFGGQRGAQQQEGRRPLSRHTRRQFGIAEARQSKRSAHHGSEEWAQAKQKLKRRLRQAHRAAKGILGEKLEHLALADPVGFYLRYRGRPRSMRGPTAVAVFQHFERLLGGTAGTATSGAATTEAGEAAAATTTTMHGVFNTPLVSINTTHPTSHFNPILTHTTNTTPTCVLQHSPNLTHTLTPISTSSHTPHLCLTSTSAQPPAAQPPATQPSAAQRSSPAQRTLCLASLAANMHGPFRVAEVSAFARRVKARKSVAGSLPPWLLKAAVPLLSPALTAQFSAWGRVGQLSGNDGVSIINPIPKPGGDPNSCESLRGIAVGTLAAKLYACVLEARVSEWAEASGCRASGQFGFRRKRSTGQAAFVLRTLQEQHRRGKQQLWTCFVDFKQAYDRVPRQLLWEKLEARGLGGEWLRAVKALYADVAMAVRTSAGISPCFQATMGLKQGCPLSPTLFGLYIDDFEGCVLAAAQQGAQLDLPVLGGEAMPPLLYADDMALLATSAAGLQAQLRLLEQYCERWGLTVNTVKTKLMLLSGARTQQQALAAAQQAGFSFGGAALEAVHSFKYLGIWFCAATSLAGSAGAARALLAGKALSSMRSRCAELGVEAVGVRLQLFSTMVDSVLSYGAEVWAPQLAARAAASNCCSSGSKAEALYMRFLRQQLGVRQSTPNAVVLAELGESPLWLRWLKRAARLWNRLLAQPPGSLMRRALEASITLALEAPAAQLAQQSWAGQLAAAMGTIGMPLDLQRPAAIGRRLLQSCGLEHHLAQLGEAATREGASKLLHYVEGVQGGCLEVQCYGRAEYLGVVRERRRREALAQLRTGSHWGAEETGRWARPRVSKEQRVCPHCAAGVEDVAHMVFRCPLYSSLREQYSDLFAKEHTLRSFFQQPAGPIAHFAAACRQQHETASVALA